MTSLPLVLVLLAILLVTQLLLLAAVRGLGLRFSKAAVAGGLALPFLLLAPWIGSEPILAPLGALGVPGGPALPHPDPHSILNDTVFQFFPWELEVRHALKEGRLPLWSDLADGGSSPWVNPQAGALSLIALLARALPIQHFLLAALALKILVAFEGAWLLARRVGASRRAALLAGGGFALGGGILAWGLFPHTQAGAWVPWVMVGAIGLLRRPRPIAVATTALLTAVMLLSGHPETAANGGLFAAGCALLLARRRRPLVRGLASAALAAALGFCLAAPQLLPFAAALPGSQRARDKAVHTSESGLATGVVAWAIPGSWFYEGRGRFLAAPLDRHAFGPPYSGAAFTGPLSWPDALTPYAGVVALAGAFAALFAALFARAKRAALPFLLPGAVFLLLAAHPVPLLRALFLLPPLRLPAYDRLLLLVPLALAVAGALGIDALLGRGLRRGASGHGLGARDWAPWLGLAVATGFGLVFHTGPASLLLWAGVWIAVLCVQWGRWGRWGRRKPVRLQRAAYAGLGLLLLADLVPWGRDLLPRGLTALFYPRTGVIEAAAREVAAGGPWRVVGQDLLAYPGVLSVYGLADPRAHNPLEPAAQIAALGAVFGFAPDLHRYFAPFERPDQPFLDFLNVRVVISNRVLAAAVQLRAHRPGRAPALPGLAQPGRASPLVPGLGSRGGAGGRGAGEARRDDRRAPRAGSGRGDRELAACGRAAGSGRSPRRYPWAPAARAAAGQGRASARDLASGAGGLACERRRRTSAHAGGERRLPGGRGAGRRQRGRAALPATWILPRRSPGRLGRRWGRDRRLQSAEEARPRAASQSLRSRLKNAVPATPSSLVRGAPRPGAGTAIRPCVRGVARRSSLSPRRDEHRRSRG